MAIGGVAGDQQSALMGQGCLKPGEMKATFGTGGFMLLNTGEAAPVSGARLLTTVAARLDGRTTYALEGSIAVTGSLVQWLRDNLQALEAAGRAVSRVVPEFAPGPTASGTTEICALGSPSEPQMILCGQGPDQSVTRPVKGQVNYIAADRSIDPARGESYFVTRVQISDQALAEAGLKVMQPGMPAEVLIETGERSLLTYLMHPLTKRIAAAMKEERVLWMPDPGLPC